VKRLLALGAPVLLWGGVLGACSTTNAAVDRDGACFFATDCLPGLVCIEQRNGARICTDDLSRVGGDPPGQGEDDAGDEAGEGGLDEGGTTDGPPIVEDTGTDTSTGVDTGVDTGIIVDAAADG
jgi:hypothetical protein